MEKSRSFHFWAVLFSWECRHRLRWKTNLIKCNRFKYWNKLIGGIHSHRDIPYIVSGTTLFRALLLVHFSQCLFERFFFHFVESRTMKEVIFFSFSKCWKGFFVQKKNLKKIKAVLRGTELKTEFPIYFRQNEKKIH